MWSVSPSAVTTYRTCARKWMYDYVLKTDRGPTPLYMAKGTAIHFGLETYHRTGELLVETEVSDAPGVKFPVMEYIQAAIPHIPPPANDQYWDPWREKGDGGMMLEQSGAMPTWPDADDGEGPGPEWRQFIDCVEAYPDRAIVRDYKSLSSFRYAKTPEELSTNVQLVANAKFIFSESDYKEITLAHLYLGGGTKRPKAMPVSVVVSREHVEAEWKKILVSVREMAAWVKLAPANADPLPPTTSACGEYGGCPHRVYCFGSQDLVSVRRPTTNTGDQMTLLEKMMKTAGGLAGQPANSNGQPVMGVVVPANGPSSGLAALLTAQAAVKGAISSHGLDRAEAKGTIETQAAEILTPAEAQAAAVSAGYPEIVPPDAPSPISTPEEVAAANQPAAPEKVKGKRRTKAEMEAARSAEAASPPLPATVEPVPAAVEATVPTAEIEAVLAPVDELSRVRALLLTADAAFECPVETLFIDCLPAKGWPGEPPKDLVEYMHAFATLAAATAGAVDYRLIKYESKGYLATAVRVYMKGLPKTLYIDSHLSGADVVMEVIVPYVKMVYRGVR
jgi:hypothetical protein